MVQLNIQQRQDTIIFSPCYQHKQQRFAFCHLYDQIAHKQVLVIFLMPSATIFQANDKGISACASPAQLTTCRRYNSLRVERQDTRFVINTPQSHHKKYQHIYTMNQTSATAARSPSFHPQHKQSNAYMLKLDFPQKQHGSRQSM